MSTIALYPGTFDPLTNGHLDIIQRGLAIFDKVIVAIAVNVRKEPLFTTPERMDLIRAAVGPEPRLEVDSFQGLLVDYVRRRGARVVVRGLRAIADFEYEFQLAHMNRRLSPGVDTIFLPTTQENFYVSSSLVKEIASFGGDISGVVPEPVFKALQRKFPPAPASNP
jgi:pantetheine-phosphate adenylyltransferase